MPRDFTSQQIIADRLGVTPKTVRNYISRGILTGYRLPGSRAVRLDWNEVQRVMQVIPTTIARPNRRAFGPRAKIVNIITAVEPVVVEPEAGGVQ
jgi:hypothetical protein